ncbi:hypothetical protein [Roseateles sp.]|uniref:hypothetical protein n=1 Tax=Roseateles sp. TaxID=1971397 RepID=UPI003BA6DDA4
MSTLQQRLWAPYSPILLAPFRQRRHTGELWIWLGLLLLIVLIALGLGINSGLEAARLTLGIATLPALLILWCICFSSLSSQNHPNAARLVPGHVARLRRCAVGLMAALTLLVTTLYSPFTGSPLLWALAASATMVAVALSMRWWWLWIAFSILPSLGFLEPLNALTAQFWSSMKQWYLQQPASLAGIAVLVLPWALSCLLQEGGPSHRSNYTRQVQLQQFLSNPQKTPSSPKNLGTFGMQLMRLFAWPQPLWREHLLRHAKPEARSALARAELVSMGSLHSSAIAGAYSVLLLALALIALGVQLRYQPDWSEVGRNGNYGLQIGIVCSALNPLLGLSATLYRSRHEQALLMLLPGMPTGALLNRLMAQRLLFQYYLQWGLALALVAAISSLGGEPVYSRLGFYALLTLLPMGGLLLRDWSRQGLPSATGMALLIIGSLLGSALVFALAWQGVSVGALAAASVLITAGILLWRWRRYVQGDQNLSYMPVGRWA